MLQALARRYRPQDFSQVIGQSQTVQLLSNALTQQRLHPAYLFTGTRGVGKTTLARILAKSLNCETGITPSPCQKCTACKEMNNNHFPDFIEVDAASRTKVEDTRELLDSIQYTPSAGRYKVYLIDEVHMLSTHSFNALLKTLEEPPPHIIFLLATTDHQKLPATVLSRCLQFHLRPLSIELITKQLENILLQEKISFEPTATKIIATAANGSMRDALTLLDQAISYSNHKIDETSIKNMLGTVETAVIYNLLHALQSRSADALLDLTESLSQQAIDFTQVLNELLNALHHLAVLQAAPKRKSVANKDLRSLSESFLPEEIQLYYQIALTGQKDIPYAPSERTGFEMILLRMLAFTPDTINSQGGETKQHSPITTTTRSIKENSQAPIRNTTKVASSAAAALPWHSLVNQLEINGLTLALAQQCQQIELTETELRLALSPKHKPLLNNKHIERIQTALTKYFSRPMLVTITLQNPNGKTPAETKQEQEKLHISMAENKILSDQNVQKIIKTFDAQILRESIIPFDKPNVRNEKNDR